MGKEIDEAIADAMAEEEVEKERINEMRNKNINEAFTEAREDYRDVLRDYFREAEPLKTIRVNIAEYVELKKKEADFSRLLKVILDELELSYNNEYLRIDDAQKIANAIHILYPDTYNDLYKALKNRYEFEKNADIMEIVKSEE